MRPYTKITDPVFDRTVTLRDAYPIMERFLIEHFQRGELPTGELIGYVGICSDGIAGDPAALYDYLAVVDKIVGAPVEP
jgi:hypothetical protein